MNDQAKMTANDRLLAGCRRVGDVCGVAPVEVLYAAERAARANDDDALIQLLIPGREEVCAAKLGIA